MRERSGAVPGSPGRDRRAPGSTSLELGSALPFMLLVLLALTGLGHAAFLVALEEQAASTASVAVLQARLMAEGGVRRTLLDPRQDSLSITPGVTEELARATTAEGSFRVLLRPLTREILWMEGFGAAPLARAGPQRVATRVTRLLWALSPVERLRAFDGVVEHGGGLDLAPGGVDALRLFERGEHDAPAGCLDLGAELDSIRVGSTVGEATAVLPPPAGSLPTLGFLEHDSLLARVPGRAGGTVSPAPVTEGGRCVIEAASNWGSPLDPAGACGGHRPALAAEGDLTFAGGEGQGILLVTGNLRLTGGALFAGLAMVGGDLTVDAGARLHGVVRVGGRVRVSGGAGIVGAFCPALLALSAHPSLRRPIHLPGSGWIRPL